MSNSTQETSSAAFDAPVRQIMRHGVVSIVEDALLESVFHAMAEHRVHARSSTSTRPGGRSDG